MILGLIIFLIAYLIGVATTAICLGIWFHKDLQCPSEEETSALFVFSIFWPMTIFLASIYTLAKFGSYLVERK